MDALYSFESVIAYISRTHHWFDDQMEQKDLRVFLGMRDSVINSHVPREFWLLPAQEMYSRLKGVLGEGRAWLIWWVYQSRYISGNYTDRRDFATHERWRLRAVSAYLQARCRERGVPGYTHQINFSHQIVWVFYYKVGVRAPYRVVKYIDMGGLGIDLLDTARRRKK